MKKYLFKYLNYVFSLIRIRVNVALSSHLFVDALICLVWLSKQIGYSDIYSLGICPILISE